MTNINEEKCSFCSKTESQTNYLIKGISGNICDECISMCSTIMENDNEREELDNFVLPTPREIHQFLNQYVKLQQKGD